MAKGVPLSGNSGWPVVYPFPRSARIEKPEESASSALSCGFTVFRGRGVSATLPPPHALGEPGHQTQRSALLSEGR